MLESSIQTFKKFIATKNNIPETHIAMNKDFLKMIHRLVDINSKKEAQLLYEELKKIPMLVEKQWFVQKINDWIS